MKTENVHKLCLIELIRVIRENAEKMLLNINMDDEVMKEEEFQAYQELMAQLVQYARKFEIDLNEMLFEPTETDLQQNRMQKVNR